MQSKAETKLAAVDTQSAAAASATVARAAEAKASTLDERAKQKPAPRSSRGYKHGRADVTAELREGETPKKRRGK